MVRLVQSITIVLIVVLSSAIANFFFIPFLTPSVQSQSILSFGDASGTLTSIFFITSWLISTIIFFSVPSLRKGAKSYSLFLFISLLLTSLIFSGSDFGFLGSVAPAAFAALRTSRNKIVGKFKGKRSKSKQTKLM